MERPLELAVVGSTGIVGREVLGALLSRDFPADQLTLLGSERSAGGEVEYGDDTLEIEALDDAAFRGKGVVILATPEETSRRLASQAQGAGAWVVDLSDAFRGDPSVPLVLPEVNPLALDLEFKGRVVTVPSPVSTALALIAHPLVQAGLARIQVTALIGASQAGSRGVQELEKQSADLLSGREPEQTSFPHRLAFNFFPHVGAFAEGAAESSEERSWSVQLGRLFGERAPQVSGIAVQVPTFYGHGLSLVLEGAGLTADLVRGAFKDSPAVKLLDDPQQRIYPMPMLVTADDAVHLGRLRAIPGRPGAVQGFAVVDNAGRGAALAAVDVALRLGERR